MHPMRRSRLESQIARDLTVTLGQNLKDPRVRPLAVTRVVLSHDARNAVVYLLPRNAVDFSEMEFSPTEKEGLEAARGFIRSQLARALGTRYVPQLVFKCDLGAQNTLAVERLLSEISTTENTPSELAQ